MNPPEETFESFMARALHDPEHGYYARRIRSVGRRGDFTTAPMLSELPARAIASWAASAMKQTGCRDLIEIGPGEGRLSADVLAKLPLRARWKTRLHLVETSPPLAAKQRVLLGSRANWHQQMGDALAACEGHAVIFSNELVDAFPVRRFQKTAEGWQEIAVRFGAGNRAEETLLSPAPLPDSSAFSETHPPGQRVEVHDSYHRWLATWMPCWKTGRMLTIDYGSTSEALYHRRPRGTVRGYLLHQRIEDEAIYQNIGRQDLTADVNFTDLVAWSAPWIRNHHLRSFGEFIAGDPNEKALLDEQGFGEAFLVLDQAR